MKTFTVRIGDVSMECTYIRRSSPYGKPRLIGFIDGVQRMSHEPRRHASEWRLLGIAQERLDQIIQEQAAHGDTGGGTK